MMWKLLSLTCILVAVVGCSAHRNDAIRDQLTFTSLLSGSDESILLVSTLDGTLFAFDSYSGDALWQHEHDPVVNNPRDKTQPTLARFFPNPTDGSLYRYTLSNPDQPLKKLPFTIPQLVENSPCRSTDGIFYLGKKVDSYEVIDRFTGEKELVLDMESIYETCSHKNRNNPPKMYIGRTMYNVVLYEHSTGNKWNVSYNDYASHGSVDAKTYNFVHYVSAGGGTLVTLDKDGAKFLWTLDLQSPVVALYTLSENGYLISVPMSVLASSTLQKYIKLSESKGNFLIDDYLNSPLKELRPSIFLGESNGGSTYAMLSLVDTSIVTIEKATPPVLLLEGPDKKPTIPPNTHSKDSSDDLFIPTTTEPPNHQKQSKQKCPKNRRKETLLYDCALDEDLSETKKEDIVLLGHYSLPEEVMELVYPMKPGSLPLSITHVNSSDVILTNDGDESHAHTLPGTEPLTALNIGLESLLEVFSDWNYEKSFMLFVVVAISLLFYLIFSIKNSIHQSQTHGSSRNSNGVMGSGGGTVTAVPQDMPDGSIKVGKITYNPTEQLGRGSNGTLVFRGSFENRVTAVKRVLPNSYKIAEREVRLLQASDVHDNVVRYYCTEQCREFRYISLELCDATLEDYVHCKLPDCPPSLELSKVVMVQASLGLAHLHKLNIVHRDIKPSNVLLQLPTSLETLRVRISDFGLCRQLETGHASFTKQSGVTGTDGWIAPEMIRIESLDTRPTKAVDVFSLGCVYYYVYSLGEHPYGSYIQRQNNILNRNRCISRCEADAAFKNLLESMLDHEADKRPPVKTLEFHCFLWSDEKALKFLTMTSDIVDKKDDGKLAAQLSQDADCIASNWTSKLDQLVSVDLRRHRDYRNDSVKDLLRAIRNKFSHYHEMNTDMKNVLGAPPSHFLNYWVSRYPDLLYRVWLALHIAKGDEHFVVYYSQSYDFVTVTPAIIPPNNPRVPPKTRTGTTTSRSFRNYNDKRSKKPASEMDKAFEASLANSNWRDSAPSEERPAPPVNVPWVLKKRQPRQCGGNNIPPPIDSARVVTPARTSESSDTVETNLNNSSEAENNQEVDDDSMVERRSITPRKNPAHACSSWETGEDTEGFWDQPNPLVTPSKVEHSLEISSSSPDEVQTIMENEPTFGGAISPPLPDEVQTIGGNEGEEENEEGAPNREDVESNKLKKRSKDNRKQRKR